MTTKEILEARGIPSWAVKEARKNLDVYEGQDNRWRVSIFNGLPMAGDFTSREEAEGAMEVVLPNLAAFVQEQRKKGKK